jgi:DNA-binding transcriptional LysR family regulator
MTLDRRISLHKLAVFSLVVELGSVSRAAEQLMVSQPVVSAHLGSLETALRCPLLKWSGGRRRLTPAGTAVHRFAQDALRATRELERELARCSGTRAEPIALAASMALGSYRLAPVLARFLAAHSAIEVHGQIADLRRIVAATTTGAVDFGLVLGEPPGTDPALDATLLGFEPLVLLGAPGETGWPGPLAVNAISELRLVEGHGADGSDDTVRQALQALGVTYRVAMELGHPEAVKRVVRQGGFQAFLPLCTAAAELERGELEILAVEELSLAVPVYLLLRVGQEPSDAEQELIDGLQAEYLTPAPAS